MDQQHHMDILTATVIGDIGLVLLVAGGFALLARRLRQPRVIGEIVAGIALGPSLLGLLPGDLPGRIFSADARPFLSVIAQVGLLFFMFTTGWEFDAGRLRGKLRSMGSVWILSIGAPVVLGLGLAWSLYGGHSTVAGHHVRFLDFALFLSIAMSITAFPVLARIIVDQGLHRSRVGTLALALAAADDVLAWCMLAVVVALAGSQGAWQGLVVAGWALAYLVVMFAVVRPLLARLAGGSRGAINPVVLAAGLLLSAWCTALIGIHPIFGAFLFGLVLPRQRKPELVEAAIKPLRSIGTLLMPLYFVVTGLAVNLTVLNGKAVLELLAIIAVAVLSKLGAVAGAARLTGLRGHESYVLGLLMNTRGLTELVILNVGLQLGILDTQLFSSMVVMALVTTMMAAPLLARSIGRIGLTPPPAPRGDSRSTDADATLQPV